MRRLNLRLPAFLMLFFLGAVSALAQDETPPSEPAAATTDEPAAEPDEGTEEQVSAEETEAPKTDDSGEPLVQTPDGTDASESADEAMDEVTVASDTDDQETEPAEGIADEAGGDEVSGEAAPPASAADAFAVEFAAWKELLKELRDIRAEYLIASEEDLESLQEQWTTKLAQGKLAVDRLRDAALAAYQESPNADREIVRFLVTTSAELIRADRYAEAYQVATTLLGGGSQEKELHDLAGIAAFGTNRFAEAQEQLAQAQAIGSISAKGTQFIGGLDQLVAEWDAEQAIREAEVQADDLPRVRLETSVGSIVVELFENEAPQTVGNFISLVEKGFYDQLTFHRVMEGFMAQGGDPNGDGSGGPGYEIYCECTEPNHRKHFAGSLSMAKSTPINTGGSQFFINFVATPHLNGKHTVFGRVIEGMEVLPNFLRTTPDDPKGEPTQILKAEVLRKRDHEYRPTKVR